MSKHIETPEIDLHSEYYEKHGMSYVTSDEMECEHTMAISVMAGLGRAYSWKSYCDVGAGSGRGILLLKNLVENANIIGIEPVKTLRSFAVKRGIPENQIIDGNAVQLPYKDCFFDCVYATGILHHICKPRLAIKEMWRIARHALVLFDLNNFDKYLEIIFGVVVHTIRKVN